MKTRRSTELPVLPGRIRERIWTTERVRPEYSSLNWMPIEDALTALSTEACERLEDGPDHIGTMWEAAHAYMDGRAQRMKLQKTGPLMSGAREALSGLAREDPCEDEWHPTEPKTPEQDLEANLAMRWLAARIDSYDPRRRAILREGLGIDDASDQAEMTRTRSSISPQRISQIWISTHADLCRAWRTGMERSMHVLEHGGTMVVLPDVVMPETSPEETRKATDGTARHRRSFQPKIVKNDAPGRPRDQSTKSALMVCGVVVTRIGQDAYAVDGEGSMDADAIGEMIHGLTDECQAKDMAARLKRRDHWLANGYRAASMGAQWPHPVGNVPRLVLTGHDAKP